MATNSPYVKSLIWLVCAGGIGYGLMRATAPSNEKIARIKGTGGPAYLTDAEIKKLQFLKRLRGDSLGETTPPDMQKKEK